MVEAELAFLSSYLKQILTDSINELKMKVKIRRMEVQCTAISLCQSCHFMLAWLGGYLTSTYQADKIF